PEQHLRHATDARTDQFSFCVALYEGLYGERPFLGKNAAALALQVTQGKVQDPPKESRVPDWLRRIVLRGLRVVPDERYPSMDALLHDLGRDPRLARRRALLVAAAIVLVGVGAWAVVQIREGASALCRGAEHRLEGLWDAPRKEEARAAFLATG